MPSSQATGTEENYYSIAIGKSDADGSHPNKKNKIQVSGSFGHSSNGDNAHTHFKEKTMRSICITLVIGHISSWTKEIH
jgi:hypothetical protein